MTKKDLCLIEYSKVFGNYRLTYLVHNRYKVIRFDKMSETISFAMGALKATKDDIINALNI